MKRFSTDLDGLFDAEPGEDIFDNQVGTSLIDWLPSFGLVGVLAVVVLVSAMIWRLNVTDAPDFSEHWLSGRQVGQLQAGAVVELAGVEIGRVREIAISDGLPVAHLQLNHDIAQQLASDSRFTVQPLNGNGYTNVGVSVRAGRQAGTLLPRQLQLTDSSGFVEEALEQFDELMSGRNAHVDGRSPFGYWLTLAGAACVISVIVVRVAKTLLPMLLLLICFALPLVGFVLVQQGVLSSDSLPAWATEYLPAPSAVAVDSTHD